MMRRILMTVLVANVLALGPSGAIAQADVQPAADGVRVGKMSSLRKLVPETQLEAQALQQYAGMKAQAQQQGALGSDRHPQVVRLRAIAGRLIPYAQRWNGHAAQWQWEVNLIGSQQINAFCMPGGKIAFFSGILDSLKLTDDEIAIVMGHEMAHALREHGRERAAKSALTGMGAKVAGIGLAALLGVDAHLTSAAAGGIANLTLLKFSRDDETEADLVGLDIAARAGYDPRAGIAVWQKMAIVNEGAPPQWLSTHPAGQNRIAEIRRHLPEVMSLYAHSRNSDPGALPPYRSNTKQIAPVE